MKNIKNQEANLLSTIRQTLPKAFLVRFQELQSKIKTATITTSELSEMQIHTEKIEAFDTKKLKALFELSKLRSVPF